MRYRKALFGWVLCFAPVAAAAAVACATGPEPSNWTGPPASTGGNSTAANQDATGSSSGTPAGGTGATSGVSASSSGGNSPAGSGSGSGTPVTSSSSGVPSGGSSDAASSGSGSGGTPNTTQSITAPDIFADAGPYAPPVEAGQGEHNPGQSCIQLGCHAPGQDARFPDPFTIAGTVFKDYAGTIPYVGAEVRVQDATGRTMTTYTHDNGNFSFGRTVALPAVVAIRDATTTREMVTQLTTAAMGSCAMAGCHVVGGSPSTGSYYPIHLP